MSDNQGTPSNVTSNVSLLTRIKIWWESIPLFTKSVFFFCILVFIFQSLSSIPKISSVCYNYAQIRYYYQIYRIITHQFFHASLLHILFNMFALISLGMVLEKRIGTFNLLCTTLVIMITAPLIEFLITFVLLLFIEIKTQGFFTNIVISMATECGIGYSGVLFAYLTVSVHYDQSNENRSLFGLLSVPGPFYPWILLLITSLIMPGVSFIGHLCGILAGYVFAFIILRRTPYPEATHWLERKLIPSLISQVPSYFVSGSAPSTSSSGSAGSAGSAGTSGTSGQAGRMLGDGSSLIERIKTQISQWWNSIQSSLSAVQGRVAQIGQRRRSRRQSQGPDSYADEEYGYLDEEEANEPSIVGNEDVALQMPQSPTMVELEDQNPQNKSENGEQVPRPPSDSGKGDNHSNSNSRKETTIKEVVKPRVKPQNVDDNSPSSSNNSEYFNKLGQGRKLGA